MFIDPKTDAVYGLHRDDTGTVRAEDGREVIGWLHCDDCTDPVPVKLNRGGHPYYGCLQCNNQHKPQSIASRGHFTARMKPLHQEQENDHDSAADHQGQETQEAGSTGSTGSGKGKRHRSGVGMF